MPGLCSPQEGHDLTPFSEKYNLSPIIYHWKHNYLNHFNNMQQKLLCPLGLYSGTWWKYSMVVDLSLVVVTARLSALLLRKCMPRLKMTSDFGPWLQGYFTSCPVEFVLQQMVLHVHTHGFLPLLTRHITSPLHFILWRLLSYPSPANDLIPNLTGARESGLSHRCPYEPHFH